MLLYHFTATEFLDSILENGLNRGEVQTTPNGLGVNAVWLTTDPKPAGHGLTEARALTDDERERMYQLHGTKLPPGARFANKRAIRLTVKVPAKDHQLKHWPKWAAKHVDHAWLEVLNSNSDCVSARQPRTWYLCFRTIEPHEFVAVEHLKDGVPSGAAAIWHEAA